MTKEKNDLVNAVVEIDEVEYLINEETANKIHQKEKIIPLMRIIDHEIRAVSLESIQRIVQEGGIIDHLNR